MLVILLELNEVEQILGKMNEDSSINNAESISQNEKRDEGSGEDLKDSNVSKVEGVGVESKNEGELKEESRVFSEKDNIIFVGIKPFMNYVTGVVMQFQNKGQDEVLVSARGKFTAKAIDVVEVARRTFLKDEDIQIEGIKISSEQFENKEGKRIFVSAIEIKLVKG